MSLDCPVDLMRYDGSDPRCTSQRPLCARRASAATRSSLATAMRSPGIGTALDAGASCPKEA